MKANRKKLLADLSLVKAGLATKEVLEQSTSFVFQGGFVYTYNDEIAISHPVDIDVTGALRAKEFLALLNKTADAELDLVTTDAGLEVKGKKYTATIKLSAEILLPINELEIPTEWDPLPKNFGAAVKFCLFSVSKDMTKPALTCIHAFADKVESSDNHRLTIRYFAKPFFKEPLLIPANAAKELVGFGAISYKACGGWLHFCSENDTVFSCRTYDDLLFPSLEKVIELEDSGEVKFPEDMQETLGRASIFSESQLKLDQRIKVGLDGKNLTIEGQGDAGKIKETARVRYTGEPCHFYINPDFLASVLKLKSSALVGADRLLFEDDEFIHVVALLAGE